MLDNKFMSDWITPGRYDFSIPEAQWLSDLTGIELDLEAVINTCKRCLRLSRFIGTSESPEALEYLDMIESLSDFMFAAIVRYGRTFNTGVRKNLPIEWIEGLSDDLKNAHEYFKNMRNKYIAHSVNHFEDNQVFVTLSPQFSEEQTPSHIMVEPGRLITFRTDEIEKLSDLAKNLKKVVKIEIENEKLKLLDIAKKLPLDSIKSRRTSQNPIPSKSGFKLTREKFK
jgi:hypothetical protein